MRKKTVKMMIAAMVCSCVLSNTGIVSYAAEEKDTICNVGSVSKTYVTTAVLQLADRGLVNLDEPVVTYLKDFRLADERYKDITVRMLMNHSSGLMGSTFGESFLLEDNDMISHDTLLEKLSVQRLKANPGEYSVYCNDGFWVLELLVEAVSGESFTDYIANHIAVPLGLTQTGTPVDMFQKPEMIDIVINGNRIGNEYVMDIGSGGIIASASDLCKYGSGYFFHSDGTKKSLLSEESKEQMFTSYAKTEYDTPYGLGWDSVAEPEFEKAGVKVVMKGGSTAQQFASLMVAPEEEISVAVLSAGDFSMGSMAVAKSLMMYLLQEEKGIPVEDIAIENQQTCESVPREYRKYEGFYTSGSDIFRVEFPDMRYMRTIACDVDNPKTTNYKMTTDGRFVRMDGEIEKEVQDPNQQILEFIRRENGKIYIGQEVNTLYDGFSVYHNKEYMAEKLDDLEVSDDLLEAFRQYEGTYCLYSGKYSNMGFSSRISELKVSESCPGYLLDTKGNLSLMKIVDETHANAFAQIPGQNGRDQNDITIETEDGNTMILAPDLDMKFIRVSDAPTLNRKMTGVTTKKDKAVWYSLDESTKGMTMYFEKPERASIYVFDKFDKMVYSSYMLDWPDEIALPSEGRIVFVGDDDVTINFTLK
ncbi:MAG: serine hydrolase [bacterium]|nr:serine hydrolase [bacterium]